MTRRSSEVLAV